jgi:CDP-diacylglycerol--glycerol-3-phosphate 3-phosphatidyltransferase
LSTDYFTNRQDRYIVLEDCKELADFYDNLINKVSDFSFQLDGKNVASLKPEWKVHPSEGNYKAFISDAKNHVVSFYENCRGENKSRLDSFRSLSNVDTSSPKYKDVEDTWVFPLIQMGSIGVSYDKDATCKVFENTPPRSHIKLATGYFNLTTEYVSKILQNENASYDILMAHPTV